MSSNKKKKLSRRVLRINQANILRLLKVIASHGIVEQGPETAVRAGKEIFYYQKGSEKSQLSDQDVGKLIFH